MGIKSSLKKILPRSVVDAIKSSANSLALIRELIFQGKKFNQYYSRQAPKQPEQLKTRIMFLTHALEKGLSHSDFRFGFGKHIFVELPQLLSNFEEVDSNYFENVVYKECMSALAEYIRVHEEKNVDISWQKSCFTDKQLELIANAKPDDGGTIIIQAKDKLENSKLTFERLIRNRHSIREFSTVPVPLEKVKKAIDLAMYAPSVCNRQSSRVYIITNEQTIKQALRVQGGFVGYPMPKTLLLVTSDLRAFMNVYERNECYTDGGLFSMMLLLSLESLGIASCPLNTMFSHRINDMTREIVGIHDYEVPIMYIAVGQFPQAIKTCRSARYDGSDITFIDE